MSVLFLIISVLMTHLAQAQDFDRDLLYRSMKIEDFNEETFLDLCDKLFEVNRIVHWGNEVKVTCHEAMEIWTERDLQVLENVDSGYLSLFHEVHSTLNVVFNGSAMFLGTSYSNRDWRIDADPENPLESGTVIRDYALIIDDSGIITVVDQNKIFIESLPETITVSRCMSEWELNHWTNGTFDMSEYKGDRIHFGYGEFNYDKSICTKYRFPRRVLEELDRKNLLEINTYEYAAHVNEEWGDTGMTPASYSPFGIPFEIVVFFEEGVQHIKPHMRRGERF